MEKTKGFVNSLFGFTSQTYDPFAGMGEHRKLKKMISKSNIKLMLEKDRGFSKQKAMKSTTKVMLSQPGENVANAYDQPMTTGYANKGRTSTIAVNAGAIAPILEQIPNEKQLEYVHDSLSNAYGVLANKKSGDSKLIDLAMKKTEDDVTQPDGSIKTIVKEAEVSNTYGQIAKSARVLAATATRHGGLKDMNQYVDATKDAVEQSSQLGQFMQGLTMGIAPKDKKVADVLAKIKTSTTVANANDILIQINNMVKKDILDGRSITVNGELLNSHHPLMPMYNIIQEGEDMSKDKKSDTEAGVGHGNMELQPDENLDGMNPDDKRFENIADTMEFDAENEKGKHKFFRDPSGRHGNNNIDENAMEKLAEELYQSLKGRMGRLAGLNPSKRLSKRNIASGLTDKIYMSTTEEKGKYLNVNVIIDTSGSMSGHYIKDAKEVAYVMNILAEKGIFTGNIILTGSRAHALITLPMPRDQINRIGAFGGGEGIRECFRKFKPEMKKGDFNICLTDGMLSDGHIDKDEMLRQGISITGGYVAGTKETILEFTGSLNRWFHKSFVRPTTKELILALVAQGVMHTKGQ